MGKFTMTSEEKAELKTANSTAPRPIPGSDGQSKGTYHNPVTGREITSLADAHHLMLRLRQGWKLGPASPELKEKWKIREAELSAEDDAYVVAHVASNEHREAESTRFNDAVASATAIAVAEVLEKLKGRGVELPAKETPLIPLDTGIREETEPEQLDFLELVPPAAASESETKHVVSQAARPYLHLVD